MREELEQLLDDDGDMAEMFLTRKIAVFESDSPSFSVGGSASVGPAPTIGSRISRGMSRGTYSSYDEEEDVEELEQLLEVLLSLPCFPTLVHFYSSLFFCSGLLLTSGRNLKQIEHSRV